MRLFLNGGGDGPQIKDTYTRLEEVVDTSRPCLYIPLAMDAEYYTECYAWIHDELMELSFPRIDMVRSAEELSMVDLTEYGFIFIGGGNTYKLLSDLKRSGAFYRIIDYLDKDIGVVFGGSAGAIIFGNSIDCCEFDDPNLDNFTDTDGVDVLNGYSIFCHYTSRHPEEDRLSREFLLNYSYEQRVFALPEEITFFINGLNVEIIGNAGYYLFADGKETYHLNKAL